MSDELARRIRAAREELGWSQQKLADVAGVSQTTIDKIERGETKRSKFLAYITRALNVDLSAIEPMSVFESQIAAERLKAVGARAGNLGTWDFEVPLFVPESMGSGLFEMPTNPVDHIAPPKFLERAIGIYAIYIADSSMSPELAEGDIVFADPKFAPIKDTTAVFKRAGEGDVRTIMRISESAYTSNVLTGYRHEGKPTREDPQSMPREEWPEAHRIRAKYYRQ